MTWLEFKRKVREVASRLTTDAVPITFAHAGRVVSPDDITVCCRVAGDKIELVIDLKEGGDK